MDKVLEIARIWINRYTGHRVIEREREIKKERGREIERKKERERESTESYIERKREYYKREKYRERRWREKGRLGRKGQGEKEE